METIDGCNMAQGEMPSYEIGREKRDVKALIHNSLHWNLSFPLLAWHKRTSSLCPSVECELSDGKSFIFIFSFLQEQKM